MSDSIGEALDRLRSSGQRLNEITDQAAQTVAAAEDFLNKACSIGVDAGVPLPTTAEQNQHDWFRSLVYTRVGKRFRIAVVSGFVDDPDSWTETPWSDCSRDTKLESLPLVPRLLQAVADAAEKRIIEAAEATAATAALLAALQDGEE